MRRGKHTHRERTIRWIRYRRKLLLLHRMRRRTAQTKVRQAAGMLQILPGKRKKQRQLIRKKYRKRFLRREQRKLL